MTRSTASLAIAALIALTGCGGGQAITDARDARVPQMCLDRMEVCK